MLRIVQIPNKVLIAPTEPITQFDEQLKKLVKDMEEALDACVDPQGVGLAATQIGKNISMFIMKPTPDSPMREFINPVILEVDDTHPPTPKPARKRKKKEQTPLEGCLSVPRIWSPVKRAYKVHLRFQDVNGKVYEEWFEDFDAIIVQHEVDHLQGILFTQRALEQNAELFEEKDGELKKMNAIL
jgi:peptide deformylase